MEPLHSSQAFVRALKGASDPPIAGGRSKIELARNAWENVLFYVPRKEEVIADWLLTKLIKDKDKDRSVNPIVDDRYWSLLSDVISTKASSSTGPSTLSVKSWLVPLLNRVPFAPIIISFLHLLPHTHPEIPRNLILQVRRSLAVIWPLAVHKLSTDTLLECLGTLLGVPDETAADENLNQICLWIVSSYRTSLENSSAKKKVYNSFTQLNLSRWIERSLMKRPSDDTSLLTEYLYDAGIETVFNLDSLRHLTKSESENSLFDALQQIETKPVLLILPRIFSSFVQAIKKYRGALFPQTSSQTPEATWGNLRVTGMRFYASCQALLYDPRYVAESWTTRASLLALVEEETLFIQTPGMTDILRKDVESVLDILGPVTEENQKAVTSVAVDCLSTLTRIDYDLVLPSAPIVLPKILALSGCYRSLFVFLDLLLDYHTKTRTMSSYIKIVLSALSSDHLITFQEDPQKAYEISSTCALLHPVHLEHFGRAVQLFLVPAHVLGAVRHVLNTLENSWEMFRASQRQPPVDDEGPRREKKLSDSEHSLTASLAPETQAIPFALTASMSSVVLSSIPMHSVPQDARAEMYPLVEHFREHVLYQAMSKTLKTIRKHDHSDTSIIWATQIVAAGSLRLQYALNLPQQPLTLKSYYNERLPAKLLGLADNGQLPPELSLEIASFRTLLGYASAGHLSDPGIVLEQILQHLDKSLKNAHGSQNRGAMTLLRLLVDRWLPVLDSLGSAAQLERLMQYLVAHSINDPEDITANVISAGTLTSAQFWELPNLRMAFLLYADKATSALETSDAVTPTPNISLDLQEQCDILGVYHSLLSCPPEYLSRPLKIYTVKRALSLDRYISRTAGQVKNFLSYSLCVLRVYVSRMLSNLGPSDLNTWECLQYLIDSQFSTSRQDLMQITLDLIEALLSAMLKSSEKNTDLTRELIHDYSKHLRFSSFTKSDIRSKSFLRMVNLLIQEHPRTNFPDHIQAELHGLHDSLLNSFVTVVSLMDINSLHTIVQGDFLQGWYCVLSLGRLLGLKDRAIPVFGRALCSKLTESNTDGNQLSAAIGTTVFDIVLEEFYASPEPNHLDIVIASYIALSRVVGSEGCASIGMSLKRACNHMSTTEYTHITELTATLLSEFPHSSSDLAHIIQLSSVLLQDPPSNTAQSAQAFTTRCINVFASRNVYASGPAHIRQQVLQLLVRRCTDRPASLHLGDLSGIWSIISKIMLGSESHDDETSIPVFHDIIAIISALVRLRRDLISLTLPHLGMALRQLLMLTRRPRPHLGGKQSSIISNTLPVWINIEHPLGPAEGKILARLLEALAIKSVPRTHSSSTTELRKAESLSKPFSKHAAYVLKAYIDAMNDPLCILPSDLRKELYPGLFALCGMLNEHSRDALMLSSLDSGGKTTMKSLWKEYEKQHYVGRG